MKQYDPKCLTPDDLESARECSALTTASKRAGAPADVLDSMWRAWIERTAMHRRMTIEAVEAALVAEGVEVRP